MIEVVILISIMWVVMTAIFFFLLSKNEGTKGITSEYLSKNGIKRTAKKEREDYIVWIKPSAS